MKNKFGWDLPPGVTTKDIDDAFGEEEELTDEEWDDMVGDAEYDSRKDDRYTED